MAKSSLEKIRLEYKKPRVKKYGLSPDFFRRVALERDISDRRNRRRRYYAKWRKRFNQFTSVILRKKHKRY